MHARVTVLILLLSLATAQEPTPRQVAATAAADLGAVLKELLGEELRRGGPETAARLCSESAQVVTEDFARERGVEIRRVSQRYRNQRNQPDEWESAVLKRWAAAKPAEYTETVTDNGKRYLRYMKPILMEQACLACHGVRESLQPEVAAVLNERYPRDKATGYKAGELRGAFSVLVALPR